MADLRTNYQDDVLDASKNTARVYDLVDSNGTVVLAGVHLEDKTVYTTEGDDYGATDINTQNGKINELSNDLTDVSIGSQIGNGTSNFTVSSSKRRLLCITKKNDVIIESKEIPMSVLNANDVIPLGNQAPIIGVAPKKNLSGITTQTSLVGKEIANYVSSGGYPALFYDSNDQTNYQNIQKSIGLATDLGNALGAKITYNGNDAFTINVADSSLSVYVY